MASRKCKNMKGKFSSITRGFILRIICVITTICALVVCLTFASHARAYEISGHKWSSSTIIVGAYGDVSGTYRTALQQAIDNYNQQTHVHLSIHNGGPIVAQVVYESHKDWAGLCERDGSQPPYRITWARTKMNTRWMTSGTSVAKKRLVWLHELGHALGLNHTNNASTVMYFNADYSSFNGVQYLTRDDINGINAQY